MRALRRVLASVAVLLAAALPPAAQTRPDPAMLVADDVELTAENRLIARGNVEAHYEGRRLTAERIAYDRATDRLEITGPLTLTEGNETIVLAESASLDSDFANGILRGARMVLRDHLQLAAHQMRRTDARISELYKATVTSCRVCESGRPPLWQIRAKRVIHDKDKRRLFFHNAQLRVLDIPVLYLPRLRLPDGSVDRETGFLGPGFVNSTLLGTGVRVPLFITLGESRDLTLAPFWATNSKRLDLRYRQLFRRGELEIEAAVADDDFSSQSMRGYLFASGRFALPRDFRLRFRAELTSDDTFLLDHDISEKGRLQSGISVERARHDDYVRFALDHFESLRANERDADLPQIIANGEYERRIFPSRLGGEVRLTALTHGRYRNSDRNTDAPDFDVFANGSDVTRVTAALDWRRQWVLPGGMLAIIGTGISIDHFEVADIGATGSGQATEITPSAALRLRWPLIKRRGGGATHIVEPAVQLAWVGGSNPDIPGDESRAVEFDEGNLFSLSRFPAPDRRERDLIGTVGLSYTRISPGDWQGRLALGQVYRDERLREPNGTPSFSTSSGLRGRGSDLLLAAQFRNPAGLVVTARSLLDGALEAAKAEARVSWRSPGTAISATYVWLPDDPSENRFRTVSEWSIDGRYRVARNWTATGEWRFDTDEQRSLRAGAGLTYTNECIDITLSVTRRFSSSSVLEPETNFGFRWDVRGFSSRTSDTSYTRRCRN